MKTKGKCKQFITVAALLAGAAGVLGGEISTDFNAYTAPYVISSNTSSGVTINNHVELQDSSASGTFTVWGATGTSGSYSLKVLGDNTGSNYLNLNSTKIGAAYNLLGQVSTSAAKSLSENWSVKIRFSTTAGSGSMYLGLYAGGAMSVTGGYGITQVVNANSTKAAAALSLIITPNGSARIARTGISNVLEFWDSSTSEWTTTQTFALTGLDVTGATQYDLTLSTDGTTMNINLINAITSKSLINLDSSISDLGRNITKADTVRFSAGDITSDSNEGWSLNIYSLLQIPGSAATSRAGFVTVGLRGSQNP